MSRKAFVQVLVVVSLMALALPVAGVAAGAEMKLLLPQNRTTFQTNELIDLSVLRTDTAALPADKVTLTVAGEAGKMTFAFPARGADCGKAQAVEHLHLNGWLFRPGKYTVEAAAAAPRPRPNRSLQPRPQEHLSHVHWGGPSGKARSARARTGWVQPHVRPSRILDPRGMDFMGCCRWAACTSTTAARVRLVRPLLHRPRGAAGDGPHHGFRTGQRRRGTTCTTSRA